MSDTQTQALTQVRYSGESRELMYGKVGKVGEIAWLGQERYLLTSGRVGSGPVRCPTTAMGLLHDAGWVGFPRLP